MTGRHAAALAALVAIEARVVLAGHAMGIDSGRYLAASHDLTAERYPPGLPVMIAAARTIGWPAWTVTTGAGVVLVGLIWYTSWRLAGPIGAIAASVFCLLSELAADSGVLLMSDTPAAALVIGSLLAAICGRWRLAGFCLAASAWVRLPNALFVIASQRRSMLITGLAGVGALGAFNLITHASPSTYDANQVRWAIEYASDALYWDDMESPYGNVYFYASVLGGQWSQLVPLLPIAAVIEMWHRRTDPVTQLAALVVLTNLGMYLFYFYQSARFVLPAASVLIVYAATWIGRMLSPDAMPAPHNGEASDALANKRVDSGGDRRGLAIDG